MLQVTFGGIRAATLRDGEDGQLVWANQSLVGVLLPAEGGWFLQLGLGPCEREGVLFSSLDDVEGWVRSRIPATWGRR